MSLEEAKTSFFSGLAPTSSCSKSEKTEQEEAVACGCEEMKESDMRMEKHERLRRCKEGGDHENSELLLNWGEPLWVVAS
ncbi:hypothetical protein SESBI_22892 [Sesbania bispinosa]|nr:hypothetical protein SESBI_22892 [Sesbania bispinosa]